MIAVLLILVPLLTGFATFFVKNDRAVRSWALVASLVTLTVSVLGLTIMNSPENLQHDCAWIVSIGARFSVKLDSIGQLLCLLNALAYPLVVLATWNSSYKKPNNFFALMLLAQAGMMGVFLATDALLFYFFWELALIPMYFLCSQWGGERRIQATFKFFIYTFVGSLLMLIAILFVYVHTPDRSFSFESFTAYPLTIRQQYLVFFMMLAAFAIKMPIFPFHTWQPDTYEQAPTATVMILSGVMVKMGLFGLLRWLFPLTPYASWNYGDFITPLALIGVIYASLIAIRQDDLKRLVAYSSIAHIGLMCAAAFTHNLNGLQGLMLQMFSHGINIIGLWIVVELIERKTGTRKISELGGLAQKAPTLAILLVIVALANIGLPLTNAFPGEFLMFTGLFGSDSGFALLFTIMAGMGIILGAVYTLNMIRKVFYGSTNELTTSVTDIQGTEKLALIVIVGFIFVLGVYPQVLLEGTAAFSTAIEAKINLVKEFLKR